MLKILLLSLLSTAVFAQAENKYHQINFQTTKTQKVANDVMLINMQITAVNNSMNQAIYTVNRKSQNVKNIVGNFDVEFKTTGYQTNPQYQKNKIQNWRSVYSFSIESTDFEVVTQALKNLQKVAHYQSVKFLVSNTKKQQDYDALLEKTISAHKKRADNIALNFGSILYHFKQTNFNRSHIEPRLYQPKSYALSNSVAPSFSAGRSTINITINSTIELAQPDGLL